ncbi:MAG TPA: immunoglobulin domain-containing protein, partial [Opitutaceae bacterium]
MLHSSHPRRLWVLICSCLAFAIMSRAQTEVSYDFADSSQWVRLDTVVMRNGAALASTLGASSWSNAAGPDEAPGRVNLTVTAAQEFTYYSTKAITPGNGIVVSYDFLATEFTAGGVSRTVIGLGVIDPTTTAVAADLNLVPSITAPQARLIKLAANTTATFEARNTDNYDADTEVALVGGTWYRFTATFIPNAAQSTYHIASELRDLGTGAVVASATGDTKTASTATFFSGGAPLNFYVGILAQGQYGGAAAIDNFTIAAVPPPVAPSITTQPQSQAVAEGQDATFSVAASGTAPLSYQWKKGGADLTDGGRISGSTTATLTLTGAEAADAGSYTVVVTNTVGSATSNAATLAVHPPEPPAITTQPASQVTTDGMTVTFSVAASGTGPFTYEWRKEAAVLADGGRLSGATTASLTITGAVAADAGSYSVVVSNAVGTATSDAATLTVNLPEPPAITAQPASRSTPEGVDVTFTVEASGTGPLSYQWKKGAEVLGDGGRISGSTTATLALAAPQAADAGS